MPESAKYLCARVLQALAEDSRVNSLDLRVKVAGKRIFLLGYVESEARRRAAEEVAREMIPEDIELINGLGVSHFDIPPETEVLY